MFKKLEKVTIKVRSLHCASSTEDEFNCGIGTAIVVVRAYLDTNSVVKTESMVVWNVGLMHFMTGENFVENPLSHQHSQQCIVSLNHICCANFPQLFPGTGIKDGEKQFSLETKRISIQLKKDHSRDGSLMDMSVEVLHAPRDFKMYNAKEKVRMVSFPNHLIHLCL